MGKNRKTRWGTILLALLYLPAIGCAKVSDFGEPYMQEIFMGTTTIVSALQGVVADAAPPGVVGLLGNETGTEVGIYGLPTNAPLDIFPKEAVSDQVLPPPQVAGLRAEVVDAETLKIVGFISMNLKAERMKATASGTLVRQGPVLSTLPGDPIIIQAENAGILEVLKQEIVNTIRLLPQNQIGVNSTASAPARMLISFFFPSAFAFEEDMTFQRFFRKQHVASKLETFARQDVSLEDIADDEMIPLYRIHFKGQLTSVF